MVQAHSSSKTFQKNKLVRLKVIAKMTLDSYFPQKNLYFQMPLSLMISYAVSCMHFNCGYCKYPNTFWSHCILYVMTWHCENSFLVFFAFYWETVGERLELNFPRCAPKLNVSATNHCTKTHFIDIYCFHPKGVGLIVETCCNVSIFKAAVNIFTSWAQVWIMVH